MCKTKISDKTKKFLLNYSYLFWGLLFIKTQCMYRCIISLVIWQGYGQMGYPYGQAQYGQDASVTGQQGQPGSASAPYGAQQQMPYGQIRMSFDIVLFA